MVNLFKKGFYMYIYKTVLCESLMSFARAVSELFSQDTYKMRTFYQNTDFVDIKPQ